MSIALLSHLGQPLTYYYPHSLSMADNIGFGFNNCVKLFDFGLAKELDPYQKLDNGLYKMSGGTGSRRFSKISTFLKRNLLVVSGF